MDWITFLGMGLKCLSKGLSGYGCKGVLLEYIMQLTAHRMALFPMSYAEASPLSVNMKRFTPMLTQKMN